MPTGAGTGTPAAFPHTVTAAELISRMRIALADTGSPATWDDDALLAFLSDAIREYSQHLPRVDEAELATLANERLYSLPWDALAVLSVEYPDGREPPAFLRRLPYKSARFAAAADAYDFLPRYDLSRSPLLWLSFQPEPAQTLRVRCARSHTAELAAADYLTVPADHHHVLLQYVLYAAARRLQAAEQTSPANSTSLLMGQLAANTRRLEQSYLNALNRILTQRQGESGVAVWGGIRN